jgi:hypothetical protein
MFVPIMALLVGVAMMAAPNQAHATFQIRVSDNGGVSYQTVNDNNLPPGTVSDTLATTGVISASFSFTNVTVLVTVGQSKPVTGGAKLDIGINGTFSGAANLIVDITDLGFGPPSGPGSLVAVAGGSALGNNFQFKGFGDNANAMYGGIDTAGTLATPPLSGAGTSSATGTLNSPYSLSARTSFAAPSGTSPTNSYTFSIDNNLSFSVPAPAGIILALTGLPGLGIGAWLRRRQNTLIAA